MFKFLELICYSFSVPGDIEDKPVMTFQNHSYTSIIWGEPIPPRGKNEYYEVKLKKKADDYENIVNVTSKLHKLICLDILIINLIINRSSV